MRKDTLDHDYAAAFIAQHAPRHDALDAFRSLIAAKPEQKAEALATFNGLFTHTADTTSSQPKDLIELYGIDLRAMWRDYEDRPDHYTARQHEILLFLVMQRPINKEPTAEEKNGLVLSFLGQSATDKHQEMARKRYDEAQRARREAEENDGIVLDDGRTANDLINEERTRSHEPTFEKQDYGDKVLI